MKTSLSRRLLYFKIIICFLSSSILLRNLYALFFTVLLSFFSCYVIHPASSGRTYSYIMSAFLNFSERIILWDVIYCSDRNESYHSVILYICLLNVYCEISKRLGSESCTFRSVWDLKTASIRSALLFVPSFADFSLRSGLN